MGVLRLWDGVEGSAPQPVKKRCWWSRLNTDGAGTEVVAVDAGEDEKTFPTEIDADAREVVETGANRSAT